MVRSLRYFLSLAGIFLLATACDDSKHEESQLSPEESKKRSAQIFEEAMRHPQGSPECMTLIEKAIQTNTNNAEAWRELSVAYLKRGYPHLWKPLFDSAVKKDPIAWQGWRGSNRYYFYRDYEGAIADFNATDTLTPKFTDHPNGESVDYLRGLCYLGLKDYSNAKKYFGRCIAEVTERSGEDWVDVNVFFYQGITHHYLQQTDSALVYFDKGIKYYDNFSECYYHKARILLAMGQKEEAKRLVIKGKELFEKGYSLHHDYVEMAEQLYRSDFEELEHKINRALQ